MIRPSAKILRHGVALACTLTALASSPVVPAGALETSDSTRFILSGTSVTVFQAFADEGGDSTTVSLIDSATGELVEPVVSVPGDLNALGFYDNEALLVGLVDSQFVSSIPINNAPALVTIDAEGQVVTQGALTAPPGRLGGTVLSYIGAVDGDSFYTLGLQYDFAGLRPTTRVVVGTVDLGSMSTTWSDPIDFSADAVCQAQLDAMKADVLAGRVPQTFVQDIVVSDGAIRSIMSGDDAGVDYFFDMGVDGSSPTCTPLTGDIPGSSGGVALDANGDMIAFSLDDGSVWKHSQGVVTEVAGAVGTGPFRGDLASNRLQATASQRSRLPVVVRLDGSAPADPSAFNVYATDGTQTLTFPVGPDGAGTLELPAGDWVIYMRDVDGARLDSLAFDVTVEEGVVSSVDDVSAAEDAVFATFGAQGVEPGDSGTTFVFSWLTERAVTTTTTTTTMPPTSATTTTTTTTPPTSATTTSPATTTSTAPGLAGTTPTTVSPSVKGVSTEVLAVTGTESKHTALLGLVLCALGLVLVGAGRRVTTSS